MEWIFQILKGPALYGFVSLGLVKLGAYLKGKDSNTSGTDDAAGDICLALAPAISSLEYSNDKAFRKTLKVVHTTIGNYLNTSPAA